MGKHLRTVKMPSRGYVQDEKKNTDSVQRNTYSVGKITYNEKEHRQCKRKGGSDNGEGKSDILKILRTPTHPHLKPEVLENIELIKIK